MEDCTRVVLYGTFDGFGWDTDGNNNILLVLDNGDKVEIPNHFVKNASDFVEKNQIKLKDVIARIENFDLGTKAVWINEILNKLGSDYGLHKYYAGYKQGKFDGSMEYEKVTVPQFVADLIKYAKEHDWDLEDTFQDIAGNDGSSDIYQWYYTNSDNMDKFARAWLDGYTVEEEKRYIVKMKGIEGHNSYLKYNKNLKHWYFGSLFIYNNDVDTRTYHTRKELEDAGFGWVFDCPGMEVEEVEE